MFAINRYICISSSNTYCSGSPVRRHQSSFSTFRFLSCPTTPGNPWLKLFEQRSSSVSRVSLANLQSNIVFCTHNITGVISDMDYHKGNITQAISHRQYHTHVHSNIYVCSLYSIRELHVLVLNINRFLLEISHSLQTEICAFPT